MAPVAVYTAGVSNTDHAAGNSPLSGNIELPPHIERILPPSLLEQLTNDKRQKASRINFMLLILNCSRFAAQILVILQTFLLTTNDEFSNCF